ncbi:MAG: prepilin-type N-terminal cleavage/methylation domain-containing protein [Patescibacteria group bacterium]|nr:prepilin-type N-terminal cleavage/methylation domain-containing protein [Patescibacteria group bacterium]MDE2590129.1 prepilin-type N-terminal cleavage/methylation domain-containing protein [Patescibacteria group bacterium]
MKNNHGQTLIEVLIAFATLAVIITASTMAVLSALNNAEFIKNQHLALQYAQQGMEIVRSMRENQYDKFLGLSNPENLGSGPPGVIYYCMAKSCTSLTTLVADQCGQVPVASTPCTDQNVDAFIRSVAINRAASLQNSCNILGQSTTPTQITVSVSWIDGLCPRGVFCHTSSVTSCLATVNPAQTP